MQTLPATIPQSGIFVWPKGCKVSRQYLEELRAAAKSAGLSKIVIDKSDLVD